MTLDEILSDLYLRLHTAAFRREEQSHIRQYKHIKCNACCVIVTQ